MSKDLQQRLFDVLLQRFSKRVTAIDRLSELLGIGRDGVYRRMRGDTALSPAELEVLAQAFNISIDSLISRQSGSVFFSFNGFDERTHNFNDYLRGFQEELEHAQAIEGTYFYYASIELPLFQSCFYRELICFKLYIWGLTVLGYESLQDRPFSFDLLPDPLWETTRRIQDLYVALPSTELWGTNVVDNTLNQIEYHVGSGHFGNIADALLLCNKLTELTFHMQAMAAAGEKFLPGQKPENSKGAGFSLYYNEMVYTSNTLLAVTPNNKMLFTSLSNPHFLKSADPRLCDYMERWFKAVTTKSNSISVQAEKQRQWFFNRLRRRIENARLRISLAEEN